MSTPVIRVENVSKEYRLGDIGHGSLRRDFQSWWARIRGSEDPNVKVTAEKYANNNPSKTIWALKDVSFDVHQGEVLGIIGRNGAGKSTLFKILSRITSPTTGIVKIKGRAASLLEVGTGFHQELTGRENIYLNGTILGMRKNEIDAKFDEIVSFAELEQFIDTPVKRYSSGMSVRLAFAVAAHLDPEILILDEVLAVGDAAFQAKCLGKMGEVAKGGRTVLFVSHNMGAIQQLCSRVIVLDSRILFNGNCDAGIKEYLKNGSQKRKIDKTCFVGTLQDRIELNEIRVNGAHGIDADIHLSPATPIAIQIVGTCRENIPSFRVTFSVYKDGIRLFSMHDTKQPQMLFTGKFTSEITIPAFLLRPGEYSIAIGGYRDGASDWFFGTDLMFFNVSEEWSTENDFANFGLINIPQTGTRNEQRASRENDP